MVAETDFDGMTPDERERYWQWAISEIEAWFEGLPEEERDLPALIGIDGELTPRQVVEEVHGFTEHGRRIVSMLDALRQQVAARED